MDRICRGSIRGDPVSNMARRGIPEILGIMSDLTPYLLLAIIFQLSVVVGMLVAIVFPAEK